MANSLQRIAHKSAPCSHLRRQPAARGAPAGHPIRSWGPRKSAAFVGRGRTNGVERMSPEGGRSGAQFVLTRRQGPFLFLTRKRNGPCPRRGTLPSRRSLAPAGRRPRGRMPSSERIALRSVPLAGDMRSVPFVLPLPTKLRFAGPPVFLRAGQRPARERPRCIAALRTTG